MKRFIEAAAILLGIIASVAAWRGWLPYSFTETLAFVTGAWCVYLVIKQNIWNFPIGIANNIFFFILFFGDRLYGDATLQIIYLILAIHGWYSWLYGGQSKTGLRVERSSSLTLIISAIVTVISTFILTRVLRNAHDPAPMLDALTTVLSLVAQYLLNKKLIENWYLWMLADVIYVYVYITRSFYLTAFLYA